MNTERQRLSVDEAAEATGYSPQYVRRLAQRQRVEVDQIGRVYLIYLDSLLAYLRRQVADGYGPRTRGA